MFDTIPTQRPNTPLLDKIDTPSDLRQLDESTLPKLAEELRAYLLYSVGQTGGHFGAGLGVVELTLALHYVFNTPQDKLVWDVGHQTYPHKILTGRREAMSTLRHQEGISGFPKRGESKYDTFGVGHSSTSISAALGMAIAARDQGLDQKAVAVIGDGAMTAGMAFEALNHAAHTKANMLVVLNDNQMSISHNEGGLASYFAKIWASKFYTSVREGSKKVLSHIPPALSLARKTEEHMKGMVAPGTLFEELGFNYIGPIDGHDLSTLIYTLRNLSELEGPQLLHIMTRKGKGYTPAEKDPVGYHAISKIEPQSEAKVESGQTAAAGSTSASKPNDQAKQNDQVKVKPNRQLKPKYQAVFGQWLCDMAEQDKKLVGITPAMCDGSGMVEFAQRFPEQYHDVAIAEQHAVTFAAGLACDGMKPVVAIYSTFLQRAYDQLIHDVAIQNLDVTFGIDRAGLVGEDGPTHAGAFDLSFMRCIPNMVIAAPSDENETRQLLYTAYQFEGPAAVRYPRGKGPGADIISEMTALPIGKGVVRRESSSSKVHDKVVIFAFGTLLHNALTAADKLDATVVDMRFVKPLDTELISELSQSHDLVVTVEENVIQGGAGSAVNEYLMQQGLIKPILNLGLPDTFIDHGKHGDLLKDCGLDADGILASIQQKLVK